MTDEILNFMLSPTYAALTRNTAIIALIVATVAIVVAVAHYGRAREGAVEAGAPWPLLMGTLRDSFVLTLLYTFDALLYRASDLAGTGLSDDSFSAFVHLAALFGGLIVQLLILGVATLRVIALTRWLRPRKP